MPLTNPPIGTAQNTDRALRMLAAQRRLYSDAKTMHGTRLITVSAGTAVAVIAALTIPQWRTPIGIISRAERKVVSAVYGAFSGGGCRPRMG